MSEETKVINQENSVNVSDILDFKSISEFEKEFKPYGKFKIKMPTPYQVTKIGAEINILVEGQSQTIDNQTYNFAEAIITLDNVIIEKPNNFPNIGDFYDQDFIIVLWSWFLECKGEFDKKVKKNKEDLIKK